MNNEWISLLFVGSKEQKWDGLYVGWRERSSRLWQTYKNRCESSKCWWCRQFHFSQSLSPHICMLTVWQWRIWCREDCEHQACHPVLCNNCSHWGEEEGRSYLWQNAGESDSQNQNQDCQGSQDVWNPRCEDCSCLCRGLWKIRSSAPTPYWRPLAMPRPWGMTTPPVL